MRCQRMLNDTRIRNAKPKERDYKLTDFDGLQLLVRSTGAKLWRFAYRFAGKQKQLAGQFPTRVWLGACRVAWVAEEVEAWIEKRIANRAQTSPS